MTFPASPMQQLLADHHDALLADWRRRLQAGAAPDASTGGGGDGDGDGETVGTGVDNVALRAEMAELLSALQAALGSESGGDGGEASSEMRAALSQLDNALRSASQLRAARGLAPEVSVRFLHGLKDAVLALLRHQGPADAAQRELASLRLSALFDRCVMTLVTQLVATRESVIRSQAESLLDMATPVITLWESILLLPLVGIVDSVRAVQVAERLLEAIGQTEAEVTLIDVTGVPVMDTSVARHLLRTVAAAEMLGTRVILTGISPTTAQTMVKLGIDLSAVPTRGSLKGGVALALAMTGRQVSAVKVGQA